MKEFKVISIVDRRTLAIDAGENQVHEGQYIAVLNNNGRPLYDDENNIMGYIPTYKNILNINSVQENISFCTALPIDIQHDVLTKYSDSLSDTLLGDPMFYSENDKLYPEEIMKDDKVIVLY